MIHLITLNPAIDHFINVEQLALTKTNYAENDYIVFGGKAINVAHVLTNLDQECRLITTTDSFYNNFITTSLQGIDHHLIPIEQVRINTKINVDGEITEINSRGQSIASVYTKFKEYVEAEVKAGDYVLMAGNPHPADYQFMIDLCRQIKVLTNNLIIDSSKLSLKDVEAIKPLLIKPNDEEIETLLAKPMTNIKDLLTAAAEISRLGAEKLAITLGANGSIYYEGGQAWQVEPIKGAVVNTVGAGDSFVAGLIYGLANKASVISTLKSATACASATTFNHGLATKKQYEIYLEKVVVSAINKQL